MLVDMVTVVLLAGAVVTLASIVADRIRVRVLKQRLKAEWRILVEGKDSRTAVYIIREVGGSIVDQIVVAVVRDDDPEYSRKFADAEAEAEERVAHLERNRKG